MKKPLVVIEGATSAGKSDIAVRVARRIGGEIISADSMQVYRGMDIGTGKVTEEEKGGIPHYLIDVADPGEPFDLARYKTLAAAAVRDVQERGKIPVVCGGTGFYIQALVKDIDFSKASPSAAYREALEKEAEEKGNNALHERLAALDPEAAHAIHPNNIKRVIRALEVYELTGIPLSEHARRSREVPPPWDVLRIGIGFADREKQYARIRQRVDQMLEQGLCTEVRAEYTSGRRRATAAMAIGYKELLPWLEGREPLEDGIFRVKQETCRYAKRQGTWFRRNSQTEWILRDEICSESRIFEMTEKMFQKNLAKRGTV